MNKINVVFSFDENYMVPAFVAALSLLDSSLREGEEETYDLFFLMEKELSTSIKERYEKYLKSYSNCGAVKYVVASDERRDVFESRHLTRATYLRLEIPELIGLDKVIYSDIDVLFLSGLKGLWDVCVDDVYLAATLDIGLNQRSRFESRLRKLDYWEKYYAGRQLRESNMTETWRRLSREKFNYHDMDIINITCYPEVKKVSSEYNIIPGYFVKNAYQKGVEEGFIDKSEIRKIYQHPVMIHYAGAEAKPWKNPAVPGGYEYWTFLKKFPDIEKFFKEKYPWSLRNKIFSYFLKPLF